MDTERSRTFGSVAEQYERYRLGYPAVVADEVLTFARRPVRTAIEIGAGTGKATRLFSERGIAVLATDPDAAMLAELRRAGSGTALTLRSPFESLPDLGPVDLVYAAAALHWTRPEGRWSRIAALLVPGGTFASMAIEIRVADAATAGRIRAVEAAHGIGHDVGPVAAETGSTMSWPGNELLADERFTDARQARIERTVQQTAADHLGLLSTFSGYAALPAADRTAALDRVRDVLPECITLRADVVLHLARVRG